MTTSTRPSTPDRKTPVGRRATVKRCCNGCGRVLGDVTEPEMDAILYGRPLPDVSDECGCMAPSLFQALLRQDAIAGGEPS